MEEQLKMYDEIFRVVGESLEEKLTKLNYENYEKLDSTDLGKEKKKKFNKKIEEYFAMYRDVTRRDSTEPGYVAFKEKLSDLNKKLKDEGKDQIENAEDFFSFKKKLEEEKEKHDTPNDESKSDDAPKNKEKKEPVGRWARIIKGFRTGLMIFIDSLIVLYSISGGLGALPIIAVALGANALIYGVSRVLTSKKIGRSLLSLSGKLSGKAKEKVKTLFQKIKSKNKRKTKRKSSSDRVTATNSVEEVLNDVPVGEKSEEDMTAALDNIPTDEKSEEDKVDDMSTDDKSKSDVTPDLPVSNADIKEQREQKIQRLKNKKQRLFEAKERLRKQKEEQAKQENGVQDKSNVVTHSSGTHENIIDRQLNALTDNHVGYTGNYDETDLEKRIIVEDELKNLNEQIAQLSNSGNYDGNYDETEIEKQALIERKKQLEKLIASKKSSIIQTAVIDDVRTQSRVSKMSSQNDDVEKINLKINELSNLLDKFNYVSKIEKNGNKEYSELSRELEELKKIREKIIQQKNIESIQQSENQEEFSRKM